MDNNKQNIERLNLVLRTIRSINRLLVKERNPDKLLKGICQELVKNRGYHNAWIVVLDKEQGFVSSAQAGLGKKFLPMLEMLKSAKLTYCAQRALSQSSIVVTEDPASICIDCPLASNYEGRGAMTIRLEYAKSVFGILSVSTPKYFVADKEEKSLIKDVAGDIAFALHSMELEEKHKKADEELQESEKRYRIVFENTGTATFIIEEDTTISMVNTRFEELSGYSKKEVEGKMKWTDFVAEEDLDRMLKYHFKRRQDEKSAPTKYEFRFIDKNGNKKDMFCKIGMIPGTKRSIASWMDITDLKLAEQALRESEQHFRDLIENSPIGISIIREGRVIYRNPEQERLLGSLPLSTNILDSEIIYPDDAHKVRQLYQNIASGQSSTMEIDFRFYPPGKMHSRADMKWAYCRANTIKYQGEEAILVSMMDITRSKELEHLLMIQDKMASLGHMAAGIAHEIRNPLSGINIYLDTLEKIYNKRENLDRENEILEQLQSASKKIESVIRRVMDFSKSSEPKVALKDINEPIEEALKLSSVTLRKTGIKIEKVLKEGMPLCYIEPPLIEEVILNLITNATDAMKNIEGEKKIEVSSDVENDFILVKVSDSGSGVHLHLREKIFEPFYTTKSESSGIGLSITHRIIIDHGGSIDVVKSKWGGAEFRIKIPIKRIKGKC